MYKNKEKPEDAGFSFWFWIVAVAGMVWLITS
jgi:hypothetical protein